VDRGFKEKEKKMYRLFYGKITCDVPPIPPRDKDDGPVRHPNAGRLIFEDRYTIDDRYIPDVYTITEYIQDDLISIISDLYDPRKITSIQFDIHEIR